MINIYNTTFIEIEACPRTLRTALVHGLNKFGLITVWGNLDHNLDLSTLKLSHHWQMDKC
jgi:hypothetical protein